MKVFLFVVVLIGAFWHLNSQIIIPAHIILNTANVSQPYNWTNSQGWNNTNYQPPPYYWQQPGRNNSWNNTNYNPPPYYWQQIGRNNSWNNTSWNNTNPWNNPNNGSNEGHLFVGYIGQFDKELYHQVFYKPSRWWEGRDKIVEYPSADLPPGYNRNEKISAIRIFNQFVDGSSARATILKGGIGQSYVKIKLSSKRGKGLKFLVKIYGQ